MLYSPTNKFLFIHIQKTGGKSVERLLSSLVPDAMHHELSTSTPHASAMMVRESLRENFSGPYRFAFVRNPYDRLLSWYSMIAAVSMEHLDRASKLQRSVRLSCPTFENFVLRGPSVVAPEHRNSITRNQIDYLTDASGSLMVDFVGRFERFAEDFSKVLERLGLNGIIPHINASSHGPYREAYSLRMRAAVRWRFRHDIAKFDYRF